MIGSLGSLFFYEVFMGLFSKKKRVSTATQTLSLLADTPDVVQQSVTYSVLNGSDVSTDMMNTMLGLFKYRVAKYYRLSQVTK